MRRWDIARWAASTATIRESSRPSGWSTTCGSASTSSRTNASLWPNWPAFAGKGFGPREAPKVFLANKLIPHGRHLSRQCVLEAKVAQVLHALRVKDAVEMVHLVLNHPSVEALDRTLEGRTVGIQAAVAQPPEAGHQSPHAGHRQTALPAFLQLSVDRHQLRVDQHRVRDRADVRIPGVLTHLENDRAQAHPDLWRRNPGP